MGMVAMPKRLYLIPVETNGNARGPKYLPWRFDPDPPALVDPASWDMYDFGGEPYAIAVIDVDDVQHALLAAEGDVVVIPQTLDQAFGLALGNVQNRLESVGVPANHWLSTDTWRVGLQRVCAVFGYAQRYNAISQETIYLGGINLGLRMNQLSATRRDQLQQVATDLGYDLSTLSGPSTVRDLLALVEAQAQPISVGGVTI